MAKPEVKTKHTRAEMEEIIRGGGSVHYGGEIITTIAGLPDDVDLADTPEDKAAALERIEEEERRLAERKAKLTASTEEGDQVGAKSKAGAKSKGTRKDVAKGLAQETIEE